MDEIFNRGTCRYFKELTPVPDEELLTLVKAGMQARAVGNQKSRDFIIVTREDLVKAIDAAIADMQKDGSLKALSEKWFGADVTK